MQFHYFAHLWVIIWIYLCFAPCILALSTILSGYLFNYAFICGLKPKINPDIGLSTQALPCPQQEAKPYSLVDTSLRPPYWPAAGITKAQCPHIGYLQACCRHKCWRFVFKGVLLFGPKLFDTPIPLQKPV